MTGELRIGNTTVSQTCSRFISNRRDTADATTAVPPMSSSSELDALAALAVLPSVPAPATGERSAVASTASMSAGADSDRLRRMDLLRPLRDGRRLLRRRSGVTLGDDDNEGDSDGDGDSGGGLAGDSAACCCSANENERRSQSLVGAT